MITDFLKTKRSKSELQVAREVIREFKKCENAQEYLEIPFLAWAKAEQLEEFLAHLVEGEPLKPDTIAYLERGKTEDVAIEVESRLSPEEQTQSRRERAAAYRELYPEVADLFRAAKKEGGESID